MGQSWEVALVLREGEAGDGGTSRHQVANFGFVAQIAEDDVILSALDQQR